MRTIVSSDPTRVSSSTVPARVTPSWSARSSLPLVGFLIALAACLPTESRAQTQVPDGFIDQLVVGGLSQPVGMAFLPDGRLLVIERATGKVRMIVSGALASTDPVGVVGPVVTTSLEQGLLGVAVDPAWPARPYLYVLHSAEGSVTKIARFRMSGALSDSASGQLVMDPASRFELLSQAPDSAGEHNGGTLRFGTDGMLLVSLGDDTHQCNAQDTTSLGGMILRLRVDHLPDGPGGPPSLALLAAPGNPFLGHPDPRARLVWAVGFRNPYRFHVDPADGSLFVTDVGSDIAEEASHVTGPGQNFGWPYWEGLTVRLANCPVVRQPAIDPIYAYDRAGFTLGSGGATIVSAGVYRGGSCVSCRFPNDHLGDFFLVDFYEGFLRRLHFAGGTWSLAAPIAGQPSTTDWGRGFFHAADFSFDAQGTLWYSRFSVNYATNSGQIRRILRSFNAGAPDPSRLEVGWAAPRPTPARESVALSFRISREARVEMTVHDVAGRRVATLIPAEVRAAGEHTLTWNARGGGADLPPGIYLARLAVDGVVQTRRVVLLP